MGKKSDYKELWQKSRPGGSVRVGGSGRSSESMNIGLGEIQGTTQLEKVETAGRKQEVRSRKETGNRN